MEQRALCPRLSKAMDLIGKRWVGLILYELLEGPQRFNQMQANLPISGRLLSERLKELEKEGIVTRHVYTEIPVRVEYSLTPKGMNLKNTIDEIEKWSKEWL